ncbi:MAG TPA: 3-oxoacyl-ACP reductase [Gordonia polyisoprenivorans]|uniref:Glucose 1-dehydrogenase n=1 Tax=Gordonia polyisoprenivorans TaxID=84595 RepID=A0A846WH62_9ACTN|nr:glucose 1-dehydrogenase [Gordonia polyisoprenivorans]MBE7191412.1 glucose 1-dehydrogenase [Gordonia polyisoprenivorans]NKY00240.1 glucose 1-dehydrogenase [Gordonia polyisoprenivorans]QUD81846.1 glucose 1-dehydrogenase [Gordonia polyisoprenivorans]GAB25862.1 putative L-xylulose reductase [Gordonia polyisoprenivorans NBRC 16320 = JCM 10675]HCS56651.1 3-oxoacyl-ACP reductase [Gordonia polyisoprenivorans]
MTTMTAPDAVGDLRLDGRRALITGGAKGIGADIAARLAAAGARLVITGRDETALATTSEELAGRFSTEVCGVAVDLTDPDAPHELAGRAAAAFDGLDILINNAGISFPESVVDVDADHFDATLTVNLRAPALLAAAVGRQMVEQGTGGSIVTVASAAALAPLPEHYAYCASKAGLVMATKVLARELGPHGIRANSVCPTVVLTEMGQRVWGEASKAAPMLDRIPLGRFALPHEVSDAVVWLCSDAAAMINGVDIPIDGGYTMG